MHPNTDKLRKGVPEDAEMQSLEEMLRDSLWAKALTPDELDRVVGESFERRVADGG